MTAINSAPPAITNKINPVLCKTQMFYDREVALTRCCEDTPCAYKKYYNNMYICECQRDNILQPAKQ